VADQGLLQFVSPIVLTILMVKMSYLKLKGNVNILVGGIMSLNQSSLHRWMEFTMPRNQKILLFFGHMLEGIGPDQIVTARDQVQLILFRVQLAMDRLYRLVGMQGM
jgi:hypothetical protein